MDRWERIQVDLADHKQKLAAALEVHAFNRDIDDINDRINEKVTRNKPALKHPVSIVRVHRSRHGILYT